MLVYPSVQDNKGPWRRCGEHIQDAQRCGSNNSPSPESTSAGVWAIIVESNDILYRG